MSLAEIKEKLVKAYNEEDWMLIEDLIDVLDTLVTIGEGDELSYSSYGEEEFSNEW